MAIPAEARGNLTPRYTGESSIHAPMKDHHLRLSVPMTRILNIHAFERNVPFGRLIRDILTVWAVAATSENDPLFHPKSTGVPYPILPPQPHAGYLKSIGWDAETPPVRGVDDEKPMPFAREPFVDEY